VQGVGLKDGGGAVVVVAPAEDPPDDVVGLAGATVVGVMVGGGFG
jgi:hypothetical protein